ncbi:duf1682 family protein [Moniliophthora roreri MCA 2997]|uniref:Duf1682 family protein n=2 Tax=Moniliophthora roreri TaxID=221103 RepID=V2XT15_MONRO|nr:duf1682 family protein [Moniliophthora roreri MCA 2997]KAI3612214.1 duf1682 family protein [Moniliophthora roreri]
MSVVTNILASFAPPPVVVPEEYDGWEARWKMFVFRPAYFKTEALLIGIVIFYVGFWFIGKSLNGKRSHRWLNAHLSILGQQFSRPNARGLLRDGYSDYFSFSTGRRNIASLHVTFTLRPLHDLLQVIFNVGRTFVDLEYKHRDNLELDFKLFPEALSHDFVWAVVAKNELRSVKSDRWDLTFTRTSENPSLPPQYSVMSEFADVTDNIIRNPTLSNVLKDPRIQPHFRSLSVTDQPRERPIVPIPPEKREKHVILSLSIPSNAADTVPIVEAMFPFIDSLSKLNLRPETKTKLKKTREDLDKSLKQDAEAKAKEEREQAKEDQKAAKRKAEEERIAKLPAAEQQKILEREKKRSIRKQQGRTIRK